MEINHNYQSLADNIALEKYGYIEIQGYEGRDPEKLLDIRAYESKDSHEICEYFHLPEIHRKSVKKVAAQHGVEIEEFPDLETKSKVQKEFERWIERINEQETENLSHYERALVFSKELSCGVVCGYWRNEIANVSGIFDLTRTAQQTGGKFNAGRDRLFKYLVERIGYGMRTGQSYTSKRGAIHYHGDDELGDIDSMITTMVGIGMLRKLDVSNIYELTGEAFALLKEPKWHERHAELISRVTIVSGIFSTVAVILSIILMFRELGIVWQG